MDKNTARELIKKTFQNPFDKDSFVYFVKNLLNYIEEAPSIYRGNFIPDAFDSYIKTLERIGKYQDPEDKQIDVLIVRLKKESSFEHARTMQRNFIAWYLNGSRGGKLKDAALVAFVAPNGKDWRFSLVEMEYKLAKTQTGRVRAKEELTPARRYSFLVGIHESSHTAQSRLVPILEDDVNNPTLKQLKESFNIEKVTKEFFEKYRGLYHWLKEQLDAVVSKNPTVKKDFSEKNISTVDFAKKLLGQIVFLYFLQKKGWFGVARGKDWGEGDKQFLRHLFEKAQKEDKNYFNKFLEPLFYEALRLERPKDYYDKFECRIPFLNGGLFDPLNDYDWQDTDIEIPNELFSNKTKNPKTEDIGTGILDVFDRYNFTVKEDEPLEKEVAIDPEMLGKVFENLLEVKDRKSKGTYYTPREIIHYMCQESLINYLEAETNIDKEKLNLLVHFDQFMAQKMPKTKRLKAVAMWEGEVKEIEKSLEKIRIVDPACGSGAFLVGMMQEIIGLKKILSLFFKTNNLSNYQLKLKSIQNNLYGVDIDSGAVEIAKLRLWLSLVVDEEDIKQIKPLPNLDYKIVCGNSLLSVEKSSLFVSHWMQELEKTKNLLFTESNPNKKQEYQKQINELIKQITNGHKEFDFEIYFSEVFKEKGGFDIVIANPPYVGEKGHKELFREIKQSALKKFYLRKMDLFYFFFRLALDIGKAGSQIAFITTNYYLTADGARKLRQDLKERSVIKELTNFNELKIFESASGQHNMLTFLSKNYDRKNNTNIKNNDVRTCITRRVGVATSEILLSIVGRKDADTDYYSFPTSELYEGDEFYIRIEGISQNSNNPKQTTLNKIKSQGRALGSFCRVSQGLLTGVDKITNKHIIAGLMDAKYKNSGVYVLNKKEYQDLKLNKSEKQLLKPFFKNSNIRRYYCAQVPKSYVLYLTRNLSLKNYPRLESHIRKYEKVIKERSKDRGEMQAALKMGKWWVIFAARDQKVFSGPKIISPQRSHRNTFAYNETEWFASADVYYITEKNSDIKLKYILSLLNSKVFYLWFYLRGKKKGEMLELLYTPLMEVPIKKISKKEQKPFIELVDKILAITKDDDYLENLTKQAKVKEYEKQIDQMVYKLYGLTKEEIKVVEGQTIK